MTVLIVDGYNIVHAWASLRSVLKGHSAEEARRRLIDALAEYQAVTGTRVTVVFDGKGSGAVESAEVNGVTVRYGTEAASADHVIERLAYEAARGGRAAEVRVATSDRLERDIVSAMGVATISASALESEVLDARSVVHRETDRAEQAARFGNRVEAHLDPDMLRRLEQLRRGGTDPGRSG